jgi:hypothetical protein
MSAGRIAIATGRASAQRARAPTRPGSSKSRALGIVLVIHSVLSLSFTRCCPCQSIRLLSRAPTRPLVGQQASFLITHTWLCALSQILVLIQGCGPWSRELRRYTHGGTGGRADAAGMPGQGGESPDAVSTSWQELLLPITAEQHAGRLQALYDAGVLCCTLLCCAVWRASRPGLAKAYADIARGCAMVAVA